MGGVEEWKTWFLGSIPSSSTDSLSGHRQLADLTSVSALISPSVKLG